MPEHIDFSKQTQRKAFFFKETPCLNQDMIERDKRANEFAFELLMPQEKFIEVWNKSISPEEVAKFFGVSTDAAKIRASVLLGEIF